jgi:flavin-dependent dehydrogenase
MLGRLGLGLPKDVLVDPQLFVVRAVDLPTGLERFYQRFYTNMNRDRFDRWLVSRIPSTVDVREGCRFRSFKETTSGLQIRLTSDGRSFSERTRLLIGADGARSLIRRQAAPAAPDPPTYFALQEQVEMPEPMPYFSVFFDPEITDFYAWVIPKEDSVLVGVPAIGPGRPADKLARLKERLRRHGFRLGRTIRTRGAFILRPTRGRQIVAGRGRVGLVGEAAGWISPSSAEGFSYAFRSALALADALADGSDGFLSRYARATRSLRRNIASKLLKSRLLYSAGLRRLILRTGISSLDVRQGQDLP